MKNNIGIKILVFFLPLFLYFNTVFNEFAYDDFSVITGNNFTKQGLGGIVNHLKYDSFVGYTGQSGLFAGGRYRPLSLITFSIEHQFFASEENGSNPHISHLINILLFSLTCLLLYQILCLFFGNNKKEKFFEKIFSVPFLATILYIVHPIHTEVVANIKGRDEIMAFLGALGALYFSVMYFDSGKTKHMIWSGVLMFLALMSKEIALTFVVVIPLSIWFFRNKISNKKIILTLIPVFIATIVFLYIWFSIVSFGNKPEQNIINNSYIGANFWERYATVFYTLGLYIKLLFFPHPLTIDYYPYQIPIINWLDLRAIVPFLFYMAMGVFSLLKIKEKNTVAYSVLFYLITLAMVSNLIIIIGPFMGERFMYIPSLGFCIAIAWFFVFILNKKYKISKNVLISFFAIIAIAYSAKTFSRNFDWKNNFTLYTTDVNVSDKSAVLTRCAGEEYLLASEDKDTVVKMDYLNKALVLLKKASAMSPTHTEFLLLGNVYFDMNEYDSAVSCYKKALRVRPRYSLVITNLSVAIGRIPSMMEQVKLYKEVLEINSEVFEFNYHLGHLYGRYLNNIDSSIFFLNRAISLDQTNYLAIYDLGVAYGMKNDLNNALIWLLKAYDIKSTDKNLIYNIALTYKQLGDAGKSKEFAIKAGNIR